MRPRLAMVVSRYVVHLCIQDCGVQIYPPAWDVTHTVDSVLANAIFVLALCRLTSFLMLCSYLQMIPRP